MKLLQFLQHLVVPVSQFNKICIVLKPTLSKQSILMLQNLIPWLHRRKKTVIFLEKESNHLKKILKKNFKLLHFLPEDQFTLKADLIISLGGDGTLIGVCRKLVKNSPPVFGVNMGHLGFITEFSVSEFYEGLDAAIQGKFELTTLSLYRIEVVRNNRKIYSGYFLNDAVIHNALISRMLTLVVESNNEHIYDLSGNGLIVSSPIGSTAYSMAAGGPIIHPSVNALALTPICAHSLTHRPLVVPDTSKIIVKTVLGTETACITLDGQEMVNILAEDIITLTRAKNKPIHLIKNKKRTYFNTLKEKFTHGARDQK